MKNQFNDEFICLFNCAYKIGLNIYLYNIFEYKSSNIYLSHSLSLKRLHNLERVYTSIDGLMDI